MNKHFIFICFLLLTIGLWVLCAYFTTTNHSDAAGFTGVVATVMTGLTYGYGYDKS